MLKRLTIITTLWKRPELTDMILEYYQELARQYPIDLLCAGSEGHNSQHLAVINGWDYIEHPNQPLTQKHNALTMEALKRGAEAVQLIGSDDILSPRLIEYVLQNYSAEADYLLGLKDLYFYSQRTGKAIHHKGFIGNKIEFSIGCGRVFSRRILTQMDGRPWGNDIQHRGLDLLCSRRMKALGISERLVTMEEAGEAVDIKTDIGLTKMETFDFNCDKIPASEIFSKFEFLERFKNQAHANTTGHNR